MTGEADTPRERRPGLPRPIDPDPRGSQHGVAFHRLAVGRRFQPQRRGRVAQIDAGPGGIQTESRADQPWTTGQSVGGHSSHALYLQVEPVPHWHAAPSAEANGPVMPHQIDSLEWLDGADQQRGRRSLGFRDHVQTVVHPVDKVHVGMAGRPEHDPVALGLAKARMRGQIVLADVRLELDDPTDTSAAGVVADQPRAEQRPSRFEGWPRQDRPIDEAQPGRG
jgi:hypothetical protein